MFVIGEQLKVMNMFQHTDRVLYKDIEARGLERAAVRLLSEETNRPALLEKEFSKYNPTIPVAFKLTREGRKFVLGDKSD